MIVLSPAQIQDDLAFWLNQDREHNLFFMNGFVDPILKSGAAKLFEDYTTALLLKRDLGEALSIVPRSQEFKRQALALMSGAPTPAAMFASRMLGNPGNPAPTPPGLIPGSLGYIWPTFVEHTAREIDTMLARIQGKLRSREEICLGDRMLAEHAAFAANLLDPSEAQTSAAARDASQKTFGIANRCAEDTLATLVSLSQGAAAELDAFVKGPLQTAKSLIHPVLAEHVRREGERFMGTLATLPNDEA